MALECEAFAKVLTDEQEKKVVELTAAVAATVKPSATHRAFCTRGTYVRYLRARGWNVHRAARMLEETLKWRAAFKPDELRWAELGSVAARGKELESSRGIYVLEHPDVDGRPVVFMRPGTEKYGDDAEARIKWVVYVMEIASRMADAHAPDGKMSWVIDYVGYTRKSQPPWRVSLLTLQIVQNHYPERLGRAVNFQPPFLFELFWSAIRPFVDPVTREKLVFLHQKDPPEAMSKYVDLRHLDAGVGGSLPHDGTWDFKAYGQRMAAMDEEHDRRVAAAALELENGTAPAAAAAAESQA